MATGPATPPPTEPTQDPDRPPWLRPAARAVTWTSVAVVLSVFAVAAVRRVPFVGSAHPTAGDAAILELATRAVGEHQVLLGPYSRFGWHHPGPLYFYLLALPYRLLGGDVVGMTFGTLAIAAGSAGGILWIAHRRGGRALLVWTALLLATFLASIGSVAWDIWNPYVTILPFAFALVLAWSMACGDVWAVPLYAGVASFVAQTHIGYAPAVLVVGGAALAALVTDLVRSRATEWERRRRTVGRAAIVTGVVLFVVWLPPVVDQLTNDPGNLRLLYRQSEEPSDVALDEAAANVARMLSVVPARLVGGSTLFSAPARSALNAGTVVLAVAAAGALVLASRRRDRAAITLLATFGLAAVVAVVSLTRVVGVLEPYLAYWVSAIGLVGWIAVGAAVVPWARERVPRTARPAVVVAGGAVCVVVAAVLVAQTYKYTDPGPDVPDAQVLALTEPVERAMPDDGGRITLELDDGGAWPYFAAMLLELDKRGYSVRALRSPTVEVLFDPWDITDRRRGRVFPVVLDADAERYPAGDVLGSGGGVSVLRPGARPAGGTAP